MSLLGYVSTHPSEAREIYYPGKPWLSADRGAPSVRHEISSADRVWNLHGPPILGLSSGFSARYCRKQSGQMPWLKEASECWPMKVSS